VEKIKVGISSCLLGEKVRYDGGHKLDHYLVNTFGAYVRYIPVCPEVECGLGVPREPMQLEGDTGAPRLVTCRTRRDLTDLLVRYSRRRVKELQEQDLWGFIFKSGSPTCGMRRVNVFHRGRVPRQVGVGIFARILMNKLPSLPVEDDERLAHPAVRENFITRIFAAYRWREALARGKSRVNLVDFHTRHELLVMAHTTKGVGELAKNISRAKGMPANELYATYYNLFMQSLKLRATVSKNARVLHRLVSCLNKQLSPQEKQELLEVIAEYRQGFVPVVAPITLGRHYACKYQQAYLMAQYYLNPHPLELQLETRA